MTTKKIAVEIKDIEGKTQEVTTQEIEKITPYCPYSYPDKRCKIQGSKVLLKDRWFVTLEKVEELKQRVKETGGRVRAKNSTSSD